MLGWEERRREEQLFPHCCTGDAAAGVAKVELTTTVT